MVELLVVIAIIAILVGLLTSAVIKVKAVAKRTTAAAEIGQIANAIGTYKAKMNVPYIPSGGSGTGGTFMLKSTYAGTEPEAIYLKQLFPQLPGCTGAGSGITGLPDGVLLDANQTLVFFLTGGDLTGFQGFSTNRTAPFSAPVANENRIGPFLDFSASKYVTGLSATGSAGKSSLVDPWGSPYAYFTFYPGRAPVTQTVQNSYDPAESFSFNGTTVQAYSDASGKAFKPQSFQIISAGDNGKDDHSTAGTFGFGPGGKLNVGWTPQQGQYAEGNAGADDLSNFNGGPLIIQN
jgi:hypothetical protein